MLTILVPSIKNNTVWFRAFLFIAPSWVSIYKPNSNAVGMWIKTEWFANHLQPAFNWISDKDKISNVSTDKPDCFGQIINNFEYDGWLQYIPKTLCFITFPFTTLNKHLGTKNTNYWSFIGGILSHPRLMYNLVDQQTSPISHFISRPTFSMGDRSGLLAGQSGNPHLLLRSHGDTVLKTSKKDIAWMATYVYPKSVCTFEH